MKNKELNLKGLWHPDVSKSSRWSKLGLLMLMIGLIACKEDEEDAVRGPESNIQVETIAISGTYRGDDALSIGSDGALYVSHLASAAGTTIYKVSSDGTSTAFATGLTAPMGHVFNEDDSLIVAFNGPTILGAIGADGKLETYLLDSRFRGGSLAIDPQGNLYHTVFRSNKIFKISPEKEITEIASGEPLNVTYGVAVDENGNVYAANFSDGRINKVTPAGELTTLATLPTGIGYLIYANGVLYATGFTDHRIYTIDLDGNFSVLIGTGVSGNDDGVGGAVSFASPNGIAASSDGKTLYITQKNFQIRKLTLE